MVSVKMTSKTFLVPLFLCLFGFTFVIYNKPPSYSFTVDYASNKFLKDGKHFDFVSGSVHYFRVPHQLWYDRLLKLRASGINVVSTYVAWNVHEPQPGQFDFEGDANIFKFIEIAQSLGLYVNIRPGPYICSEWDLGGIPYFVLGSPKESVYLRTMNSKYIDHVESYFNVLLPLLKPYLYENGGPIILFQIENEYGSYKACDHAYTNYLTDFVRNHLGDKVILYTADGWDMQHLVCGPVHNKDVLTTLNFGPNTNHHPPFHRLRSFQGHGPLVNSEFYPGWLDHWGEPHQCKPSKLVTDQFANMLTSELGTVYVNFYMFFGGTNFAFYNGANMMYEPKYQPDPTSYDYDAPLTECGDTTEKYYAIRNVIKKYRPQLIDESLMALMKNSTKKSYGRVTFSQMIDFTRIKNLASKKMIKKSLLTFEELQQDYGFVLYEKLHNNFVSNLELSIPGPRDMVYVFADDKYVGQIYRSENKNLVVPQFKKLSLLVENLGRINYGPHLHDFKGILGSVNLGDNDISQNQDWNIWSLPLNNTKTAKFTELLDPGPGSLLKGYFTVKGAPADTWVDMSLFSKGVIFINNRNIGRFWLDKGPQRSLYVPSVYLREGQNEIVLLEVSKMPADKFVGLVDFPNIGTCNN